MSQNTPPTKPGSNAPEFSVSEITGAIKRALEENFGHVRVKGEVGRVFKAGSGHLYFDLKDGGAVLACTTWKGQIGRLSVFPEEGMEVVATGKLSNFGPQSKYNLNVNALEIAGVGALMAMLEKRKQALAKEGLFDQSRKKPLPFLPQKIGVITSPSGAVIRDILHRLRDRFPREVVLWPVVVQGEAAARQVAQALAGMNAMADRPDVLIVARGGGSIEDLWGFNEEIVVRAVAQSEIPVISAVGHETDTTLIDYAADLRAPTPTAAAELVVPVRRDLSAGLAALEERRRRALANVFTHKRQRLADLARGVPRIDELINQARQRLDLVAIRLEASLRQLTQTKRARFQAAVAALPRMGQLTTLARQRLTLTHTRFGAGLDRAIARKRADYQSAARLLRPARAAERIAAQRTGLDRLNQRFHAVLLRRLDKDKDRLTALGRMLLGLSYEETLSRGYALAFDDNNRPLSSAALAQKERAFHLRFHDGSLLVAPQTRAGDPKDADKPRPKTKNAKAPSQKGDDDQGSLF